MKASLDARVGIVGWIRAVAVVALLQGSLFPAVAGTSLVTIGAGLSVVFIFYDLLRMSPEFQRLLIFVIPLFALLSWSALVIAPAIGYGQDKFSAFITLTLISALAAVTITHRRAFVVTTARLWVISALILALAAVAGFAGGRAEVFGANPIWLARAMASGTVMVFWLWWSNRGRAWWAVPAIAVLVAGIFASGSRGPLTGMVLGVSVLAIFSRKGTIKRLITIAAGSAISIWALNNLEIFEGNRLSALANGELGSDDSRQMLWNLTLTLIKDRPMGVGIGQWSAYAGAPAQHLYPHNIFLEVLAEHGVIVGAIFIGIVAYVFIRVCARTRHSDISLLAAGWLTVELAGVLISGDLNARTFFFALVFALLVSNKPSRRRSANPIGTTATSRVTEQHP